MDRIDVSRLSVAECMALGGSAGDAPVEGGDEGGRARSPAHRATRRTLRERAFRKFDLSFGSAIRVPNLVLLNNHFSSSALNALNSARPSICAARRVRPSRLESAREPPL